MDSSSRTVMVGTERGVGAGGSSKSSRLMRLCDLAGVLGAPPFVGDRWLFKYFWRFGRVEDLGGDHRPWFERELSETDSICWVKSMRKLVVLSSFMAAGVFNRRGVGEGERDEEARFREVRGVVVSVARGVWEMC